MTMSDSQQYPSNLYVINNVEDIVVLIGLKSLILIYIVCFSAVEMRIAKVFFEENPQLKKIRFQNYEL